MVLLLTDDEVNDDSRIRIGVIVSTVETLDALCDTFHDQCVQFMDCGLGILPFIDIILVKYSSTVRMYLLLNIDGPVMK